LSIPKIGATDFGHKLARKFGIKVTELSPALVSLDMSEEFRRTYGKISGVAIPAKVSCGKISFLENILFTHFGLSGPAILQISLHWHSGEMIRIQLHPDIKWEEKIQSAKKSNPRQNIFDFLSQILPKSFVEVLLAEFKTPPTLQELSHQQIRLLANRLENWELIPTSTGGYSKAEVTRGGVSTDELQSATLESRKIPGLYFIGEVVDVSGWLGGYNFQWAWASGCAAAEAL
jgi:predicted Rossmann fold flavoprotein